MDTKTIFEAVDEYIALSGDSGTPNRSTYMIRGRYIWKDIRNNILKMVSHKWVSIDRTSIPHKVHLFPCVSQFLSLSVKGVDGNIVELSKDNSIPTVSYADVGKYDCGCPKGISECITTTTTTTEIITIQGVQYTKTVKIVVASNGDMYKEVTEPVANLDANGISKGDVTMETYKELICSLSVKDCGCVEVSEDNMNKISSCCSPITINGINILCQKSYTSYTPLKENNPNGHYNYDNSNVVYVSGVKQDQVLVNYKTTGDAEDDEVIPDYALMAFFDGMKSINNSYSNSVDRFQKRESKLQYNISKNDLRDLLERNKINVNDWMNSSSNLKRW